MADMKISTLLCMFLGLVSGFEVYWNVPSNECAKYQIYFTDLLKQYGITVNTGGDFRGDRISIFYESQLGIFPSLVENYTKSHNGGIPQRVNMTEHLEKATADLEKAIRSKDFDGLGVLDYEAWRPTWKFLFSNLDAYRRESRLYAKEMYPNASSYKLNAIATKQWEDSAREFFLETLRLAKRTRPKAVWGYYLFPDCYNYEGEKPSDFKCPQGTVEGNNGLSWLWKESTALYPSLYVDKNDFGKYTFEVRSWKADGILKETLRVVSPTAKIYPYVNYHNGGIWIPEEDVQRQIAQTATGGSDGVVIWGPSASVNSEDQCHKLKDLILSTIGPASEKVAYRSDLCSKEICNGRGQCLFPNDNEIKAWKLFLSDEENFYAGDITCRCSVNYAGRFCERST